MSGLARNELETHRSSVLQEFVGALRAARLTKVVFVNLPEAIAANAIVSLGAPAGLIVRDTDHVGDIVGREVPAQRVREPQIKSQTFSRELAWHRKTQPGYKQRQGPRGERCRSGA